MIAKNLEQIQGRIAAACRKAGRNPEEVTLVAVAKTFSWETVRVAIKAGARDVGENYVQELLEKRERLADDDVRWHFIGHLQSNKVKSIAGWVHLIHAVDSLSLAREIDRRAGQANRTIEVLLEVNTTGEQSKFGVMPEQAFGLMRSMSGLGHVRVGGLMTIGPFLPDPEGSRPMFHQLRLLRDELAREGQSNAPMTRLSMGMTGDFEVAIDEGATMVRIGTAIFGSRKKTTNGGNHETHTA